MAFMQSHTDYITFLYGLIFIILGGVALIQKFIGHSRIQWAWLGVFGLLHGFHEWMEIVEAAFPTVELVHTTAGFAGVISFVALFEFSRVNWQAAGSPMDVDAEPEKLGRRVLRHWPFLVLFLLTAAAVNVEGALGWLFKIMALIGGVWAAVMLAAESRLANDRIQRRWLALSAAALGLFSFCESVLAALIRSDLLSHAAMPSVEFQSAVLAAVHTLLAALTTLAVWAYIRRGSVLQAAAEIGLSEAKLILRRYTIWLSTSLVIVLATGWYASEKLGQGAAQSIRERSHGATGILASHLRDEMARTDLMASLLAKAPQVRVGLEKHDTESLAAAAATMRQHTAVLETSVAFLMAPNGDVLASSEPTQPGHDASENFGFLPYFQDSSAYGLVGKDLAVEPNLEQRGYYVSHPVNGRTGEPVGVAVVKKVLAQTDKEFKRFRDWFLISPSGIIFLSSRQELLLRPLWKLSESTRLQLIRSGEFGPGPFTGAKLDKAPADHEILRWDSGDALANIVEVRPDGWSAVIIEDMHPVVVQRFYGILATMAVALFTLCFFVIVQRETAYESKLASDQKRLEALNEELERQATTDSLTGLYNRLKFNALLLAEIDRVSRYGGEFSLVMIDVDHFKRVNDTYGHHIGDAVLTTLARLTRETMRKSDSLARWGGEEFIAILPMTRVDGALYFTERVKRALASFVFDSLPRVTCSFGVTQFIKGDTPESIVQRADVALYQAKERGRNRVEIILAGSVA